MIAIGVEHIIVVFQTRGSNKGMSSYTFEVNASAFRYFLKIHSESTDVRFFGFATSDPDD